MLSQPGEDPPFLYFNVFKTKLETKSWQKKLPSSEQKKFGHSKVLKSENLGKVSETQLTDPAEVISKLSNNPDGD